eukprot:CAMPEP_0114251306 /NCGR_PEP_ID=MMETSP0058-20121206/15199_1 /TAXON_ID=36894 /ORGANISM="Pyramimonas parkeae, CCMP726" /LENGTH=86 /DNA_ID=CAMNT_0001365097 /DNA_START=2609 /DNA_END=2869 /DNA_ORIENTATION=-
MGNNGSTAVVSAFTDPISVRLEVVNLLLKYLLPELLADEFDHLQVICEATAFCCVSFGKLEAYLHAYCEEHRARRHGCNKLRVQQV